MRISAKQAVLAAIVAGLGVSATIAHADNIDKCDLCQTVKPVPAGSTTPTSGVDPKGNVGYLVDKDFVVVRSGHGLCWRDGYWTPANAIPECDGGAKVAPSGDKITLDADFLFDFDKDIIKPEGKVALNNIINKAKDFKVVEVITAVGYTDRIGSDAYNLKLSQRRAAAVKRYLVSQGIPADKVYTEGKGEANPATGTTCNKIRGPENRTNKKLIECLHPDRRAVLEIIGTK